MTSHVGAFTGFIDRTRILAVSSGVGLDLLGWFWVEAAPVRELFFGVDGGELLPASIHDRPDVALKLPSSPHALQTGFSITLPVSHKRASYEVQLLAKLYTGQEISSTLIAKPSDEQPAQGAGSGVQFGAQHSRKSIEDLARLKLESFLRVGGEIHFQTVMAPVVSVVIPVHNRAHLTLLCLEALRSQIFSELEIIVVNNASSDTTGDLLVKMKGLRVIQNTVNKQYAAASNMGAEVARGEMLLFLNNDAFVMPTAIRSAVQTLQHNPRIGAVGAKLIRPDGKMQELGSFVLPDGSTVARGRGASPEGAAYCLPAVVDYCSGAFLLTWKELFLISGAFDERFSPAYYEDVEYCVRIAQRGYLCVADPLVEVLHMERGSAVSDQSVDSLIARNRRTFLDLHPAWWRTSKSRDGLPPPPAPSKNTSPYVLLIDDALPDPARGQGLARAALIQSVLKEFDCRLEIYTSSEQTHDANEVSAIADVPKRLCAQPGESKRHSLERAVAEASLVVVSRPHHMEVVQSLLRKIPPLPQRPHVIYDAEAIHAKREILRLEVVDETELTDQEIVEIVSSEIILGRDADVILTVSKQETDAFFDFGYTNVSMLGFGIEPSPSPKLFNERSAMLTVGPLLSSGTPNVDGVRWFVEKVLPWISRIMSREMICFNAFGENHVDELSELQSDRFRLMGFVDDLRPVYNDHRIFIAPTRFSAGLPLKVIQAAAAGIPIVATPLVASQLGWRDEVELLVGYNEQDFAAKCSALYVNSDLWEMLREKALRRVAAQFSIEEFKSRARGIFSPFLKMKSSS